jgi:O-antigen/teichoic acid export membrane protein
MGLIYGSLIVNTVAQYIDSIIIASISVKGLSDVGVYTLATFIAATIQVPQRSIISAVVPVLSYSWKTKNYDQLNRIYSRTSINLLLLALFIFFLIWLNVDDMFAVLNINKDYEAGKMVILILGSMQPGHSLFVISFVYRKVGIYKYNSSLLTRRMKKRLFLYR